MDAATVLATSDDSIRAAERKRISRTLHDSTSQLLVALQLQIARLREQPWSSEQSILDEMDDTLRCIHDSIKQIEREPLTDHLSEDRHIQTAKVFFRLARTKDY